MHDYYNECYNTKTQEYMIGLEQAAERSKNNMYNITLDRVSAYMSCHQDGGTSQGDTRHSMPLAKRRGCFNFDD